jgi:beta-lactam-binding protein with PASTA domain
MSETRPGLVAPAALAIAVIAVALAVWGLVRSPSSWHTPSVSTEQSTQAKTEVCGAFEIVRNAVSLQTNADLGKDRVAKQAVAANARLAALGGGQFLVSRLDDRVPAELADAVRSFANNLEYIGMAQLAGAPADDPVQVTRSKDAQASAARVAELCR